MPHLIEPYQGSMTTAEASHRLMTAIESLRKSLGKYWSTENREVSFALRKRTAVRLVQGEGEPFSIGKSEEKLGELLNMGATLERLYDVLKWAESALPDYIVTYCNPTTSGSDETGKQRHDLELADGESVAVFEVSDSEGNNNGKAAKDLARLQQADMTARRRFLGVTASAANYVLKSPGTSHLHDGGNEGTHIVEVFRMN